MLYSCGSAGENDLNDVSSSDVTGDTTAPAAINDLAASNPTLNSIELSWTAPGDDGDTGTAVSYDIRYSTSTISDANWSAATRVTGEPTPEAAGTTQSMTVTGLVPETTYYVAVKTADEVPNTSNQSNVVAAITDASTFEYIMGTDDYGQPTVSQPAQWETYTDPVTGLTIRRITDAEKDVPGASSACVHYVRVSPVSSNGRHLLMEIKGTKGNPYYIMDLQTRKVRVAPHATGKPYANNGGIDAQPEYRWDYSGNYPTRIYYRDGLKFYQADINYPDGQPDDPKYNVLLHDFSDEYPDAQVAYNDDEGDSSADSSYWAFIIRNGAPDYDIAAIITYDKKTDTILGTLNSPPKPNFVDVSPSGSKVVLSSYWHSGGEGSNFDGPHAWDLDFTNPVKVAAGSAHSGWAWDKSGNEGFLQINNAGTGDWLRFSNILSEDYFKVYYQGDLGWAGHHFSRVYQPYQKGWIFLDIYTNSGWAADQILAIEAIPASQNPSVWRIAYTQNLRGESGKDYLGEQMVSMSYDGTKMYYCSNWRGADNNEIYEVALPPNWWLDLQ
ncbi:MAG: fibronectin type III domain-containing protein [Nitrospirota bacterium]|nr:fibronectin type III domain-containing protein [Nitrospirota bacterium]